MQESTFKKSKYAPIDGTISSPQKEGNPIYEDLKNIENITEAKEEDYDESNFKIPPFSSFIDEGISLDTQKIDILELFFNQEQLQTKIELYKLIKKIMEFSSNELKKVIFVFSILKSQKEVSELIYNMFKSKLNELLTSETYEYSDLNKELFKNNSDLISLVLKACIVEKYENIAMEILKLSNYFYFEEEILRQSLDLDLFKFIFVLLKKTKLQFRNEIKKQHSIKSRYSQAQSFKNFVISLTIKKQKTKSDQDIEYWSDYEKANDFIQKCILKNEEKVATKIMIYYYVRMNKNFVKYSILDQAILNDSFFFLKNYFDIFPRTRYKIKDFECVSHVIDLLDDDENFLHALFLLSKFDKLSLNEVYVRMIIDKYQNFVKSKLMLITSTLNPILICAMIIQNLKIFETLYVNVRIKLKTICDEYLKLAIQIVHQISDDTILKAIFLKIFYPSNITLMKILFENRDYYFPILQNEILFNIVNGLWHCEFYWTLNFLNSSSSFKNLTMHFGSKDTHINALEERFYMNKMIENRVVVEEEPIDENETDENYELLENTPISNQLFHKNKKGEYITLLDKPLNIVNPFYFFQKTKFSKDIRYTNHIFNYFFFEKSPIFKVVADIIIYLVVCIVVLYNILGIFQIRRDLDSLPDEMLHFFDGIASLKEGIQPTAMFYQIILSYTKNNNFKDPTYSILLLAPIAAQSKKAVCLNVFPSKLSECTLFDNDINRIWDMGDVFWVMQIFFYFSFLQAIFEMIFVYKLHKKIMFNQRMIIECLLVGLTAYIHYYYFSHLNNKTKLIQDDILESFKFLEEIVAIFIFIMWIKLISFLKLIKRFGILVKIIEDMISDLAYFFVVFGIIILAFATICLNLFDLSNPKKFGSFWLTLRTLILFMFGQVDFSDFSEDNLLAAIIINIYEIITFILMVNLLLAILSNTYNKFTEKSNLENSNVLYSNYLTKKPDKFYSLLISLSPPFNFFVIIAVPILLFYKSSRVNKFFVGFGFFLYSIIFFLIYVAVNIGIVIPLCYIRMIFTLIINLMLKQRKKNGVFIWLIWIIASPFYMFYVFITHDIPIFIKSMYYSCNMKDKLDEITKEEILLIDEKAEILIKSGKENIEYQDLVDNVKEGIEEINRRLRNISEPEKNKNWNKIQNIQKKTARIIGITDNMEKSEKLEQKINVFVEVDKMEVFGFLRQFKGINGLINLRKLRFLIQQIQFCKKFHLITINKAKKNKLINVIQVVQILAVEKSVISMVAEQIRIAHIFDKVLKRFIC